MSPNDLVDAMLSTFPADRILWRKEDIIPYAFDGTATLHQVPAVVFLPNARDEIVDLLIFCRQNSVPVVTRGSGTSLSGGAVPLEGSVVLCLSRLNRFLELDRENLLITADAGVPTVRIAQAADSVGLFYPPDPGSMKISTIGGNIAHNSGGLRGLKYGVTRDYVMGMEVVLANGEMTWLGSACVKDVAGYSLKDLFIGSEGTLGVISRVVLKLIPKPVARKTLSATFATMESAAATVSAIIAAKIIPCTLEFLDNVTINCVEDFAEVGLPRDAGAMLLMESDGHPAAVAAEADEMERIAKANGAVQVQCAADAAEAARLAEARRCAFSALARVSPTTILEDVTVPRSRLVDMVSAISRIAKTHELRIGTFGHFGDGNLHPTFLVNERNEEEMARVHAAMKELFSTAIALRGTITGEHGVGIAKREFLPAQIDSTALALLRHVKTALDPGNILNPGKIFSTHPDLAPTQGAASF